MFYRRHLCAGKKRGLLVGNARRGKGTRIMAITDAGGAVLSVSVHSAGPHEVNLVEQTLAERFVEPLPERLIGDKAYDCDPLDQRLAQQGIEMIAPHRAGRKQPATQKQEPLERYQRRWKVERFFAWLFNYRRCVVRYEYKPQNFKAIVLLTSAIILMKTYLHL